MVQRALGRSSGDGDRDRDLARREARRVDRAAHPELHADLGRSTTRKRESGSSRFDQSQVQAGGTTHGRRSPRRACTTTVPRRTSSAPRTGSTRRAIARSRSRGLRGHVVLIDFWTYTCINCIRTLPYLEAWDAQVPQERPGDRRHRVARIPVRAQREQRARRDRPVRDQLSRGPGQQPRDLERMAQRILAGGLPDRRERSGALRDLGEGDYRKTQAAIRALLVAAGARRLGGTAQARHVIQPSLLDDPETYIGTERAQGWTTGRSAGRTTTRSHRHAGAQLVRLRRDLDDRSPAGARGDRRDDHRERPGQARLHRAQPAGGRSDWSRPGADQRPEADRGRRRQRRPQRDRHGESAAPVQHRRRAARPGRDDHVALLAGNERVLVHVRVAARPDARRDDGPVSCWSGLRAGFERWCSG